MPKLFSLVDKEEMEKAGKKAHMEYQDLKVITFQIFELYNFGAKIVYTIC